MSDPGMEDLWAAPEMAGGEGGECGANYWVQRTEDSGEGWINIGSRGQADMQTGDGCVRLEAAVGVYMTMMTRMSMRTSSLGRTGMGRMGWMGRTEQMAWLRLRFRTPKATGSFHKFAAAQEASS